MRETAARRLPLVQCHFDHVHSRELREMSAILDGLPEAVRLVHHYTHQG